MLLLPKYDPGITRKYNFGKVAELFWKQIDYIRNILTEIIFVNLLEKENKAYVRIYKRKNNI